MSLSIVSYTFEQNINLGYDLVSVLITGSMCSEANCKSSWPSSLHRNCLQQRILNLVKSHMNLMDTMMDEFQDEQKYKELNEREIAAWLEVSHCLLTFCFTLLWNVSLLTNLTANYTENIVRLAQQNCPGVWLTNSLYSWKQIRLSFIFSRLTLTLTLFITHSL